MRIFTLKSFILGLLLFLVLPSLAAKDSFENLKEVAEQAKGEDQMQAYIELLGFLYKTNDDTLNHYANHYLEIAEKTQNIKGLGFANEYKALYLAKIGEQEEAIDFFLKSKEYFGKIKKDSWDVVRVLNHLALMYSRLGEQGKREASIEEAFEISLQTNDPASLGVTYKSKIFLEASKGDVEKALEFADLSIENYRKSQVPADVVNPLQAKAFYINRENPVKAIPLYEEAVKICETNQDYRVLLFAYAGLMYAYEDSGQYLKSMNLGFKRLKLAQISNHMVQIVNSSRDLGQLNLEVGNIEKAREYFQISYKTAQEGHYKWGIAAGLGSLGLLERNEGDIDLAIKYFEEALVASEEMEAGSLIFDYLSYLGEAHLNNKNLEDARIYYQRALDTSEGTDGANKYQSMAQLSSYYLQVGKHQKAIDNCTPAYRFFKKNHLLYQLNDAVKVLYEAHKKLGHHKDALHFLELNRSYNDSLTSQKNIEELTSLELNSQFEKERLADSLHFMKAQAAKDVQIATERSRRNYLLILAALGIIGALVFLRQFLQTRKARRRSDELLLNILPEKTAEELKEKGYTTAQKFNETTILFTDFKGFTQVSEKLTPNELVKMLDDIFRGFDTIVEKHGLEKIKTIGDAYLAVSGVPDDNNTKAEGVIRAALEMQSFLHDYENETLKAKKLKGFMMRVGIHSGPLVAGVVGKNKFQYDIWGDAVNTAARMESSGEPEKVNISQVTYEMVKGIPGFKFSERGKVQAKNKGAMDMYFVEYG